MALFMTFALKYPHDFLAEHKTMNLTVTENVLTIAEDLHCATNGH